MKFLAEKIEYLLKSNDCVIIEGFGGFIKNGSPARIIDGYIYPPCVELSFNEMLRHDDGLLYSLVADEMQISYKTAVSEVSKHIEILKHEISGRRLVEFGNIGQLSIEKGSLQFAPKAARYLPENFALQPIEECERVVSQKITPTIEVEGKKLIIDIADLSRKVVRYAAAIAVLVAIALFIPQASNENQYAGFLILQEKHDKVSKIAESDSALKAFDSMLKAKFSTTAQPTEATEIQAEASMAETVLAKESESNAYHVVVASFNKEYQAQEYCSRYPEAKILPPKGKQTQYRCIVGSFATESLAIEKKREISSEKSSWVLHQK